MVERDDAELLAYLDGALDEQTAAQIAEEVEGSARVRARLRQLAREEVALRGRLFRATCPDSLELGEYFSERLPAPRRAQIATHLESCPHCQQELNSLATFLDELAPELEYSLRERMRVVVARLLPQGGGMQPPLGAPLLAGVRGGGDAPLLYTAEEVQVTLEVVPGLEQPEQQALVGLMVGVAAAGWEAHLMREEEVLARTGVDELGNFIFEGLAPGHYQLFLESAELAIQIPGVEVAS